MARNVIAGLVLLAAPWCGATAWAARPAKAKPMAKPAAIAPGSLAPALPDAYARSARTWPKVDDNFDGSRVTIFLDRRDVRTLDLASGKFAPRADTVSVRRKNESFDPRELIYSIFHVGSDTLRFTWGQMAEEFGGVPRMIVSSPGAPQAAYTLAPLSRWNVDAVWVLGDKVIFGCTTQTEGGTVPQQILIWDLSTGRWFGTPRESGRSHRGFKLRNFFPEWQSSQVARIGSAIVLKTGDRALALDPQAGSWFLVALGGQAVGPVPHQVARSLVPVTEAMTARLRPQLLASFREWNHEVDSVRILEVMREPCVPQRGRAAFVATGLAPYQGSASRSNDIMATLNRELFGVFLADSSITSIVSKIDMFPTVRYLDYTLYFDLDASDDAIVVWGESLDYGDEGIQRGYRCGN